MNTVIARWIQQCNELCDALGYVVLAAFFMASGVDQLSGQQRIMKAHELVDQLCGEGDFGPDVG